MTMNLFFGVFAFGFGLLSLVVRFINPRSAMFSKLEPMKKAWGDKAGTAMHWLAYTVVPIVVGALLLITELRR